MKPNLPGRPMHHITDPRAITTACGLSYKSLPAGLTTKDWSRVDCRNCQRSLKRRQRFQRNSAV